MLATPGVQEKVRCMLGKDLCGRVIKSHRPKARFSITAKALLIKIIAVHEVVVEVVIVIFIIFIVVIGIATRRKPSVLECR